MYLRDASSASTWPVCSAVSHPAKLVGPLNPMLGVASRPTRAAGGQLFCAAFSHDSGHARQTEGWTASAGMQAANGLRMHVRLAQSLFSADSSLHFWLPALLLIWPCTWLSGLDGIQP